TKRKRKSTSNKKRRSTKEKKKQKEEEEEEKKGGGGGEEEEEEGGHQREEGEHQEEEGSGGGGHVRGRLRQDGALGVEDPQPTATRNGASSCPGSGAPPEARNGVVLLGPGAPSATATNAVACPDPDALVPPLGSAAPPATRNAVSYTGWLATQLSSREEAPAPRNAVPYPDGLMLQLKSGAMSAATTNGVASSLGSAVPPATRNAVSYAAFWLAAQVGVSGAAAATPRNAVACAYPEVLMAHLGSHHGLPTVGQNAAPFDPGMPVAHLSSCMSYSYPGSGAPSAAVNGVAYPGGLGAVTKNAAGYVTMNAACYAIDAYEGAIGFDFDHLNPTGIATAAAGQDEGSGYDDSSGLPLPSADKVVDDVDWNEDEVAGAAAERARGVVLGRLGLTAAALAVAGITGGTPTPATAMGQFAMLIAGVTLVTVRMFRA
ncbi:unnamed protein product, partial [Urochloa humidicola]